MEQLLITLVFCARFPSSESNPSTLEKLVEAWLISFVPLHFSLCFINFQNSWPTRDEVAVNCQEEVAVNCQEEVVQYVCLSELCPTYAYAKMQNHF